MKRLIKSIIIDDEKRARDIVKKYLEKFRDIEVISECSNGFEGVKAINDQKPDLIFLDIQMPKISGFEMLELLEVEPAIIFITAFDEFAVKAFEVNAVDYLLKPFSQERFSESVERAKAYLADKSNRKKIISKLVRHKDENIENLERIVIKSGSKITVISIDSVYWVEAQDDYVMVHCAEGKFLKQKTMKFMENHLSSKDFVRIHRSHIVRISQIKQIEPFSKMSYQVILADGTSLPMSKTGHKKIRDII